MLSKKLIIFGAGASFGSEDNMPPLGKSLFDELVKLSPNGWGQIDKEMALALQNNFEDGMKKLLEKCPEILSKAQKSMADFFFRFVPTEKNLYVKLAKRIKKCQWNGSIATLNYDRLLQISLSRAGLKQKFNHGTFPEIQVCYPHGCCNFFCEGIISTDRIKISGNEIDFGDGRKIVAREDGTIGTHNGPLIHYGEEGLTTDGEIKIVESLRRFYKELNSPFPPIMSYFIPTKHTTSCKNFIDGEREKFAKLVESADDIVIIGIKIRELDEHIWDPLSKTSSKITYCAGSESKNYSTWAQQNRPDSNNDQILDRCWIDNFDKICSILDL